MRRLLLRLLLVLNARYLIIIILRVGLRLSGLEQNGDPVQYSSGGNFCCKLGLVRFTV